MRRFSRKRQAILDCLSKRFDHPSADALYAQLKPMYPDLSLATVYRNLIQLKEAGLIRSMGIVAGQERFDANTMPHSHAVCKCCGAILDVEELNVPEEMLKTAAKKTGFRMETASLRFVGLCVACQQKQKTTE